MVSPTQTEKGREREGGQRGGERKGGKDRGKRGTKGERGRGVERESSADLAGVSSRGFKST